MDNVVTMSFDFWSVIQQFVNIKAVLLAVIGTQAIKYLLPSPVKGEITSDVVRGSWTTRALPFVPVLIASVVTFLLEMDVKYTQDDFVRGFMSGAFAAYLYRTTRVTIFGD